MSTPEFVKGKNIWKKTQMEKKHNIAINFGVLGDRVSTLPCSAAISSEFQLPSSGCEATISRPQDDDSEGTDWF